jgi:hypothetical protein
VLHSCRLWPNTQHYTRLEKLTRDKHCSLLQRFVNYDRKKVYNVVPVVSDGGSASGPGCQVKESFTAGK